MTQLERFETKRKSPGKIIIIVVAVLAVVYFLGVWYFQSHFLFRTKINGLNSGLHNIAKVEEMIAQEVKDYSLKVVEREDGKETISSSDFDLEAVFGSELNDILDDQNAFRWPVSIFSSESKVYFNVLEYNKDKLEKLVSELDCMQKKNMKEPVNASVSFDKKEYMFGIVPENVGTTLELDKTVDAIVEAVENLKESVDLSKNNCYVAPKVCQNDEKVVTACDNANNYLDETITYEFGSEKLLVDHELLSQWLYVDEKFKIKIYKDMVVDFVSDMADKYDTYGHKRQFTTTAGDTISLWTGDYGWWMDEKEEVTDLMKVVLAGESVVKKPIYLQEAVQYGTDDIGDTYIEVDLDNQHVYAYKNGELVGDASCVTGNPNVSGTPIGVFSVTFKELDGTLTGEDYESSVKYWVPFYGNVGIHDASWRKPGEFGGTTYKKHGSHGCVNLPESMARIVYQTVEKNYPVVVYGQRYSEEMAAAEAKKKDK